MVTFLSRIDVANLTFLAVEPACSLCIFATAKKSRDSEEAAPKLAELSSAAAIVLVALHSVESSSQTALLDT